MSTLSTTFNASDYPYCKCRSRSGEPAETQQFLDKANNVLGWESG
jgi:hypothetical protein